MVEGEALEYRVWTLLNVSGKGSFECTSHLGMVSKDSLLYEDNNDTKSTAELQVLRSTNATVSWACMSCMLWGFGIGVTAAVRRCRPEYRSG